MGHVSRVNLTDGQKSVICFTLLRLQKVLRQRKCKNRRNQSKAHSVEIIQLLEPSE